MSRLLVSKGLSPIWGCELASTLSATGAAQMALFKRMSVSDRGASLDDGATLRHEGRVFMVLDLEDSERRRLEAAIARMGGAGVAKLLVVEDVADLAAAGILSESESAARATTCINLDGDPGAQA